MNEHPGKKLADLYQPPGHGARQFELMPFSKIQLDNSPNYLIKGLVPRTGMTVVWGPPKCGKSFFVFDLVMHVALGWEYRARRVRPGAVVYCALEGAEGFKARVAAFRQAKMLEGVADVPFFLLASPMSLVADQPALTEAIRQTLGEVALVAVVIDTLNRSLAGSESDDRDMAAYVQAADAIRDVFKCAIIVVHHCGHDGNRPRGHSSLTGAADAQLAVKRDAADNIVVMVEYMKDGPASEEIVSRLEAAEVGVDEDGELITSCVIVPVEQVSSGSQKAASVKQPKGAAKIALAALQDAVSECGELPPASNHIPPNTLAVKIDTWRTYAAKAGITGSDEKDAFRKAFNRAHEVLVADHHVGTWTPWVWPVPKE